MAYPCDLDEFGNLKCQLQFCVQKFLQNEKYPARKYWNYSRHVGSFHKKILEFCIRDKIPIPDLENVEKRVKSPENEPVKKKTKMLNQENFSCPNCNKAFKDISPFVDHVQNCVYKMSS